MGAATSTILISGVTQPKLATLKSRAKSKRLSVEHYVKELIDSDLSIAEMARSKNIDEIFAPAQHHFKQSGMTESELDILVDKTRKQTQKPLRAMKRKNR